MKKLLTLSVAGSALMAAGCTTAAMANDRNEYREEVHVVVERDSAESQTIVIHGIDVELVDGDVFIDGEALRTAADGRIVISGDNVHIINGGEGSFAFTFDRDELELRMAEVQAQMENMQDMQIVVDELHGADIEAELARVEEELARNHERRTVIVNGERRAMTDEEREHVRVELVEAREEVRRAMREAQSDMQAAEGERRDAIRVMRVELERAERELAEAESDVQRIHVIARHNEELTEDMIHQLRESGGRQLRFTSEDGETRIWVDGEELEGDARTDWLNRVQVEELEGGQGSATRSIVIEIDEDESE